MVTAQNLLYSKAAVARIEGVDPTAVVRLEVWHSVIFVVIEGRRPKFYSKLLFKFHFVEWRKAQARELIAIKNPYNSSLYFVRNDMKSTVYHVNFFRGGAICDCEDFKNQSQFFGNACCKHIYSCLAQMNYSSFSEYIAA